jgi:hypothetical protein
MNFISYRENDSLGSFFCSSIAQNKTERNETEVNWIWVKAGRYNTRLAQNTSPSYERDWAEPWQGGSSVKVKIQVTIQQKSCESPVWLHLDFFPIFVHLPDYTLTMDVKL